MSRRSRFEMDKTKKEPASLASHYSDFRVQERVLLTGHSHQAWPNRARQGVLRAYEDAAMHVDDKWEQAERVAQRVRAGYAKRLDDPAGEYALGQNVHALFVRWLSSLDAYADLRSISNKAPILSSDQEFHALRRQLQRLEEYGIEVQRVTMDPQVVERLIQALEGQAARHFGAVVISAVSFMQGLRIPGLDRLAQMCRDKHTPLLIDAYHAVNVLPFSVTQLQLDDVFIVGGGYKYCQLGEGVCFLRVPPRVEARPAVTGWFAEFGELEQRPKLADGQPHTKVAYARGQRAFAGSTYDPTSHYRAAEVFDFFDEMGLGVQELREISQGQLRRLSQGIAALQLRPETLRLADEINDEERAGFLALRCENAAQWVPWLRTQKVYCDARADVLRLGPAPYLSDAQLDEAVAMLGACAKALA